MVKQYAPDLLMRGHNKNSLIYAPDTINRSNTTAVRFQDTAGTFMLPSRLTGRRDTFEVRRECLKLFNALTNKVRNKERN